MVRIMMSLQEIIEMVSNGESCVLEFKQTTGQLDRAMKTLCGFLNDKGGIVLFGVTNNGSIIGQKVSDKTKQSIAEGIHTIEPLPIIDVQYVPIPNPDKPELK